MKSICAQILSLNYTPTITFKELFLDTNIKLNISATDIDNCKQEIFNHEIHPDVPIIDVILASVSLPLIFPPVIINNKRYVDGFLMNDIPYQILEDKENMLILYINETYEINAANETLFEYIMKIIYCFTKHQFHIPDDMKKKILELTTGNNKNKEISKVITLNMDDKINYFYYGKKLTKEFLKK